MRALQMQVLRGREHKKRGSEVRLFKQMIIAAMSIRIHRAFIRFGRVAWPLLCFLVAPSAWAYSADVVLIRSAEVPSAEQDALELATRFYGLDLKTIVVRGKSETAHLGIVEQRSTVAVAVEANALAEINQNALLKALHRSSGDVVPLLIMGVTPETDSALLSSWSGSAAVGARRLESPTHLDYEVGRVAGLTQQLSGTRIPFPGRDTFYFALNTHSGAEEIMAVRNDNQVVPVFIETSLHRQPVFLLCKTRPAGTTAPDRDPYSVVESFAEIAPVLMFVKYGAGDRGWHAPYHYANFTIDDPWLREPYGELSYEGLLKEMEKHNFHTTIAFIPWNYDRSEASVIVLFRDHPERFSISIHGDNHDHQEFENPDSDGRHAAALKQALARMDKFRLLTNIPYDPVFVFPHDIGPEEVLEELKAYNYLATINSTNVPSDRSTPLTPLFALRPVTTSFAAFPSIIRYSTATPDPTNTIAINEFLDNPLFFYSHHDFFVKGIDAFNGIADEVNNIEPATLWRGLGDIVTHLYLVKSRDDATNDLLAFSPKLEITNPSGRAAVYHVIKSERNLGNIKSVTIDGRTVPFQLQDGELNITVEVPAGGLRALRVEYGNDLHLSSVATSSASFRVYFLRRSSDFRDIWLSNSHLGRVMTALYYRYYYDGYGKYGVTPLLAIALALAITCIVAGWMVSVRAKRIVRSAIGADDISGVQIFPPRVGSGRR